MIAKGTHSTVLLLLFFSLGSSCPAVDFPPQDHGGEDLIVGASDSVWGVHRNVGNFVVNGDAVVPRFDGIAGSGRGMLHVQAETITINGALDLSGAGFTGGGGGGGQPAFLTFPSTAEGGADAYGDGALENFEGQPGARDVAPGAGGQGDGGYPGAAGGTLPSEDGEDGVYPFAIPLDFSMGSGGGGGAGGNAGGVSQPPLGPSDIGGGGAGGSGGGLLIFEATDSVTINGNLLVDGALGGNGVRESFVRGPGGILFHNSPQGGDVLVANPAIALGRPALGDSGNPLAGFGGAGSGGAIRLTAPTISIADGAVLSALGGREQRDTGGLIVLESPEPIHVPDGATVAARQVRFVRSFSGAAEFVLTTDTEGWQSGSADDLRAATASVDQGLALRANGIISFGFWDSPLVTVNAMANQLVRVTATLRSGVAPERTPVIRLRASAPDYSSTFEMNWDSRSDGLTAPNPSAVYTGYAAFPYAMDQLRLSFDLIQTNSDDANDGVVTLESIIAEPVAIPSEDLGTVVYTESFAEGGNDGWKAFGVDEYPTAVLERRDHALSLRGNRFGSFGSWVGEIPGVVTKSGALYCIDFQLSSSASTEELSDLPAFRLRVNESNFRQSVALNRASTGFTGNLPRSGESTIQSVWIDPSLAGEGFIAAIDLIHFGGDRDDLEVHLEAVSIREFSDDSLK